MYGDPNEFRRHRRKLLRAHARTSLYSFYRLVFPSLAPEASFSSAPHFRILARALEKVGTGETHRLLIATPPRHGKSISPLSRCPPGSWGANRLARSSVRPAATSCPRIFRTGFVTSCGRPTSRAVFPGVQIDAGASLAEVRTSAKGYRLATTVQGRQPARARISSSSTIRSRPRKQPPSRPATPSTTGSKGRS